ncbi:hypothetical protein AMAG_20412 [Allomyces macrogynus ATCC 38327]|uniref:Uncharacterized protein n=1 Tax=Allomyces macrogynus (strain ATCC 38327) TaxID=578462 RepID=A0A0L0T8W9_ALLM3|nr:hypothetical protein AMAG_20412 [Allomyces macrogynus ATCC 38327]|eukprot:KNE71202.1 hypothetical protein AMAG_20412 [Allomyces macrogynus ATCC 38327]
MIQTLTQTTSHALDRCCVVLPEAPPAAAPAAPVRKLVPRIAMAGGRALPTGEDVAALEEVLRAVGLVVPDVGASKSKE